MAGQVRLLSSRRSYEFSPDHIRLTILSERQHVDRIRNLFEFQIAQVATPMPTFGVPAATIPPGLVFNYGVARMTGGDVPIRMLHFEQSRIVVDVAGPSQAIESIFGATLELLSDAQAPDGTPAIGTPTHVLDYSELSIGFGAPLTGVFAPPVWSALSRALGSADGRRDLVAVPSFRFRFQPADEEFPGAPGGPDHELYHLELRAGTKPSESIVFSGAPLESDAHLKLIDELEVALSTPNLREPKRQKRSSP